MAVDIVFFHAAIVADSLRSRWSRRGINLRSDHVRIRFTNHLGYPGTGTSNVFKVTATRQYTPTR